VDVVSPAIKVIAASSDAALSAHGLHGGGSLVEGVLRSLLQVADEQAEALNRIEGSVQRLIDGPWHTAHLCLQEAQLPNRTDAARTTSLQAAAQALREAVPLQEEDSMGRAYAALDMALVQVVLRDPATARMYARMAVDSAVGYMSAIADGSKWPPGLKKERARHLAALNSRRLGAFVLGGGPIMGSVLAASCGPGKHSESVDDRFDGWGKTLRAEVENVIATGFAICGPGDPAITAAQVHAPKALYCFYAKCVPRNDDCDVPLPLWRARGQRRRRGRGVGMGSGGPRGERTAHRTRRRIHNPIRRADDLRVLDTWKGWNVAAHETVSCHALHGEPGAPGCLTAA
jgi:hypothetical protein